ncbi:MAG: ABC transporter permease, partial [Ruthenibacterium sp.]
YYGDRTEKMSPQERDVAMQKLGLDKPISVQYFHWVNNALHGDFGISFKYKQDVLEVIRGRMTNTLILGGMGFVLTFVLALLLGVLCAWFEDRLPGKSADFANRLIHLILPLSVVVTSHLWYYAYMIRNKILDEVRVDYVLLAKSKGLSKCEIMFGHCLRNSMPAYLSMMAISVPHILGGTYIVETVFSYPGIGTLSYESARFHDYNLLMVLCMLSGIIVIFCNMLSQIINEHIDPRIKASEVLETSEVTRL